MKSFAIALALAGLLLALIGGVFAYVFPWRWEGRAIEVFGGVLAVVGSLTLNVLDAR